MGVIIDNLEVVDAEIEDVFDLGIELQCGQRSGFARELLLDLVKMVDVEVSVAQSVDKLSDAQITNLCNHRCQKRVRRNIEWNAQEGVGTTLVELAREFAIGHIELKKYVARGQSHTLNLAHIPRRHNHSTRIGVFLNSFYHLDNLVDNPTVGSAPATPLRAIDIAQIAIAVALDGALGAPLGCLQELLPTHRLKSCRSATFAIEAPSVVIPNVHAIVEQVLYIGFALQKPQQLVDNTPHKDLFGGQQREACREVKPHLVAKDALGARTCAVALDDTLGADCAK